MDRQTDGLMDEQTDGRTDGVADEITRQMNKWQDRSTDIEVQPQRRKVYTRKKSVQIVYTDKRTNKASYHLNKKIAALYDQKSTLAIKKERRDPMQWNLSFFPNLHNAVSPQLRLRNFRSEHLLMQLPSLSQCFCYKSRVDML